MSKLKRIPIKRAEEIAKQYGYDQVIIIARKINEPAGEWFTTYGVNKAHCDSAALQGKKLMSLYNGQSRLIGEDCDEDVGLPRRETEIGKLNKQLDRLEQVRTDDTDYRICSCGRASCMFCGDD